MVRLFSWVFLLSLIFAPSVWAGEEILNPQLYNRYKPAYIKADVKGNLWTSYYDLNNGIHIKNISEGRDLIVNEGREKVAEGLAFDVQGDHAFAMWMELIDGRRRIYFRATHDGGRTLSEPFLIDDNETEAFARLKIGSNPNGDVFILWYGNRKVGTDSAHFYSVSSNDFGKTLSEIKNLTLGYYDSIYPTLLVDGKNAYIFSYSSRAGKSYMIFRKTVDGGRTWSEPVEIKETGTVTLFIEPIMVENRLHVFWFNGYNGVQVIEGAYSDDGGKTWVTTVFEDTRGFDAGLLRVANDSKGHIYLAISGRSGPDSSLKEKFYIIRSEDNGTSWGKMTSVRHYPFENTTANNPAVLATDGGDVVVVWDDCRNIRCNLYMQYSKDSGSTWQEKDIPLETPGRFNTAHYPYTDSLLKIDDKYYILAYRFRSDFTNTNRADLMLIDFKLDSGGK